MDLSYNCCHGQLADVSGTRAKVHEWLSSLLSKRVKLINVNDGKADYESVSNWRQGLGCILPRKQRRRGDEGEKKKKGGGAGEPIWSPMNLISVLAMEKFFLKKRRRGVELCASDGGIKCWRGCSGPS